MQKIIPFAHDLLQNHLREEDICLDMTLGNGNDTLFLVNKCRFVYAFDIQESAISQSSFLLKKSNHQNYRLILDSHENFLTYVQEEIGAAIFNLGYLPKGDKKITTLSHTTLKTIQFLLPRLRKNGICIVIVYPGHPEGKKEAEVLTQYFHSLNQKEYAVLKYCFCNQIHEPPFLYGIEKLF